MVFDLKIRHNPAENISDFMEFIILQSALRLK